MPAPAPRTRTKGVLIWDLPLRLFHWLLALAVLGSWTTHKIGTQAFAWHVLCGCTVLTLIAFRIVWGFVGPRHARFVNFIRRPSSVGRYVRSMMGAAAPTQYAGHNPLGAVMVLLLLALLGVQAVAGLFANDEVAISGPLYGYVSDATSDAWSRLHRLGAKLIWVAVWVHVATVLAYLILKRENLIAPMFSGRKHGTWLAAEGIASSQVWRAALIAAACAAIVYWLVETAPVASLVLF